MKVKKRVFRIVIVGCTTLMTIQTIDSHSRMNREVRRNNSPLVNHCIAIAEGKPNVGEIIMDCARRKK